MASREVLNRLGGFIGTLEGIELRVPEDEAAVARGALFAPRLAAALDEAIALLRWSEEHYRREQQRQAVVVDALESLHEIGRLISSEIAGREVSDLLFAARGELRRTRQELMASIDREDFLRVASSCDIGLRTLKRTLAAVESALHEYEGHVPPSRVWVDLETSLQTRRLYGDLRRQILAPAHREGDEGSLEQRLHSIGERFAGLRELEIYPLLRFADRVTLRDLRHRVEEWLDAPFRDPRAGARLWQDIVRCADLLREVNHRQELRQHDRHLVRRIYQRLTDRGAPPLDPSGPAFHLAPLLGLDDELDGLLLSSVRAEPSAWRIVLGRLLQTLSARPRRALRARG